MPVTDDTREIVRGPQQGYHTVIALEATHFDHRELMLGNFEGYIGGVLMGQGRPWLAMRCNPKTNTLQTWNGLLFWDAEPEDLHGQEARIEVEVTDVAAKRASAFIDVTLVYPDLE